MNVHNIVFDYQKLNPANITIGRNELCKWTLAALEVEEIQNPGFYIKIDLSERLWLKFGQYSYVVKLTAVVLSYDTCTPAHCSYLEIYISRKIRLFVIHLEGKFQSNLRAKLINFLHQIATQICELFGTAATVCKSTGFDKFCEK